MISVDERIKLSRDTIRIGIRVEVIAAIVRRQQYYWILHFQDCGIITELCWLVERRVGLINRERPGSICPDW